MLVVSACHRVEGVTVLSFLAHKIFLPAYLLFLVLFGLFLLHVLPPLHVAVEPFDSFPFKNEQFQFVFLVAILLLLACEVDLVNIGVGLVVQG